MQDSDPQLAAMASAESSKDLEPGLSSSHYEIIQEKDRTSVCSDRRGLSPSVSSPRRRSNGLWASLKMSFFRRYTLTLFIVVCLTVVAYAAVPVVRRPQYSVQDAKDASFQDLLNSVSDASLHDVLINVYKKYRHGVFPEDRTAMKAVHDDDAAVATSLVELARRQNTNITSATVADSSTATVLVVSTTETDTIIQTSGTDSVVVVDTQTTISPVPTTAPPDSPVQTTALQVSPSLPSGPSSSVPAPPSIVNSSPSSAFTSPSPSVSSPADTTSQANPTSSPQGPDQTPTNGDTTGGPDTIASPTSPTTLVTTSSSTFTFTSSDEAGGVTSGPAGLVTAKSSSTEQVKFTTTLPDGSQSTVTSFTVVPAGDQASTAGVAGSTGTGSPGLQNGAVEGTQPRRMGVVGSLVAALVFVIGIL